MKRALKMVFGIIIACIGFYLVGARTGIIGAIVAFFTIPIGIVLIIDGCRRKKSESEK